MNSYLIVLNYTIPVNQPPIGAGQLGIYPQSSQYNQATALVSADTFTVEQFGVTFFKKGDAVAFYPTGQFRSITKQA